MDKLKQDIHIVSKYLPTNYLLITVEKSNFTVATSARHQLNQIKGNITSNGAKNGNHMPRQAAKRRAQHHFYDRDQRLKKYDKIKRV